MKLPAFEYACPATLAEAVALLASHDGDAKALAGVQSLVPMLAFRVASPALLVDLRKLPGLNEIKISDAGRGPSAACWRDILDDAGRARIRCGRRCAARRITRSGNRGTAKRRQRRADPAADAERSRDAGSPLGRWPADRREGLFPRRSPRRPTSDGIWLLAAGRAPLASRSRASAWRFATPAAVFYDPDARLRRQRPVGDRRRRPAGAAAAVEAASTVPRRC
jgi:hypothetical protein